MRNAVHYNTIVAEDFNQETVNTGVAMPLKLLVFLYDRPLVSIQ